MRETITIGFVDKDGKVIEKHDTTLHTEETYTLIPVLFKAVQGDIDSLEWREAEELVTHFPSVKNWKCGKLQVLKITYEHEILESVVYDTYKPK